MSTDTSITSDRPFIRLHVRGRRCVPVGDQPARVAVPLDAKPVAIYCRTSSRGQTIDSQYEGCRKHCERRGYAVVREYFEEWHTGNAPYFGPAAPTYATPFDRPLLRELILETLLTKPFETIVCWSSDRWSRLPGPETLQLLDALKRLGVGLEFVAGDDVADLACSLIVEADDSKSVTNDVFADTKGSSNE